MYNINFGLSTNKLVSCVAVMSRQLRVVSVLVVVVRDDGVDQRVVVLVVGVVLVLVVHLILWRVVVVRSTVHGHIPQRFGVAARVAVAGPLLSYFPVL